jgi:hypothetical protein
MLIVKIYAGLANQMFQFALYKSLLDKGAPAFTDTNSFLPKWEFEKVSLENVFENVKLNNADPLIIKRLHDNEKDVLSKIKRKLHIYKDSFFVEPKFSYNDFIFHLQGDYYLQGFWQSEQYFKNIESQIRHDFQFKAFANSKNVEVSEKMKRSNSVAVHIRKGADYKKQSTAGTCDINYYKAAVDHMKKNIPDAKFYVFSDNHAWVKENLNDFDFEAIDWNPTSGKENYLDMQLMSCCKNNIIANSSYSWWGAWLNNNSSKIVIGPNKWFSQEGPDFDSTTILPNGWIGL